MSAGLIGAVLIHAAIIAATLFSFAHKLDIVDESTPIVPGDHVTIGDQNNIAPTVTKTVQADDTREIVTPPSELAAVTPPEVDAPDEAPSEPVVKQQQPDALLTPQAKPRNDKPVDQKPKKFDINNIMNMLDQAPAKPSSANAKVADRAMKGIGAQDAATADLKSALASQIFACWNPPVGAPRASDLIVDFDLFLNRDGSVARTPQLTGDSAADVGRNPYRRAAADAAKRAIYTCAPYKLPGNRYNDWQEINPFHFDPAQMMGQ